MKPTWNGAGGPVEKVGLSISVGQIRRIPKPAHSYGSPAADLKKEEAEARRLAEAAALAAVKTE